MKFTSALASTIACLTATAMAQGGPISPCTYTATPCGPLPGFDRTLTVTVHEPTFTSTATASFDCQGCADVTVEPRNCYGLGFPVTTTTTVYTDAPATTTVDVCTPTP